MLLDSDTSLKCAHDIIHDAMEFFTKWPALIASPDDSSSGENSTVSAKHVDFEFADGSVLSVPCAGAIFTLSEGNVRESITFRNNGFSETWTSEIIHSAAGAISGLVSNGPISAGPIEVGAIAGLDSGGQMVILARPLISDFTADALNVLNATIHAFIGDGAFEINNSTLAALNAPDGDVVLDDHIRADSITAEEVCSLGEKITPVEKVNGWEAWSNSATDAAYTGCIPFEALSPNGAPVNGFNLPLIDNPFYPDWVYVDDRAAPWKSDYAWVPSIAMPNSPYWRDTDGIYWYKARVESNASMFGHPAFVWPMRTATPSERVYVNMTTPPMKADADGLIVTVHVLTTNPFPICLTDRYDLIGDGNWSWQPGVSMVISGPRVYQFIAKRNFIWTNNQITAVEYQFLPIGDIDG